MFEDSKMKPRKHCRRGQEREGTGNIMEGCTCLKYTVHMYGIITLKFLHLLMYTNSNYDKTITEKYDSFRLY
jgi:hypothetical protein